MIASRLFIALCLVWLVSELWLGWRRRSGDAARTRDRGTLRMLLITIYACIALAVWLSYQGWTRFPPALRTGLFSIGIVLMIAGMLFRAWAVRALADYFTVDVTIRPDHQLIRKGPYRWLRHPSYTGALATFYGFALALGNVLSLLVIVLPVTAAFLRRIRIEEGVLADAFPEQYPAYARETKRLVPFIW
ncbi:MAG TPA: isoprenylcysteine carboxylmethyltransferase family protein [Luteimonas sp.]|nr:isoprenylcysteine carboxylmethyltransferase family protein [Luteimonas sp.]